MQEEEIEPPFTHEEQLGDLRTKRATLEGVIGALVNRPEEKWDHMGKLWTADKIVEEVEHIRGKRRSGHDVEAMIEALPDKPREVDIRDVVRQIIEIDEQIEKLERNA